MPKKKKRKVEILWYRRATGKRDLVAVFEIEGDDLKSEIKDEAFREILDFGIVVGEKKLRLKDGIEFVDGLAAAFSSSSSFFVVETGRR